MSWMHSPVSRVEDTPRRPPFRSRDCWKVRWIAAIWLAAAWLAVAGLVLTAAPAVAQTNLPQAVEDLEALVPRVSDLVQQGRYAEAAALAKLYSDQRQADAFRPGASGNAAAYVESVVNMARTFRDAGRHAESEALFRRALAMGEKALGADSLEITAPLVGLADARRSQGHYAEAEPLHLRALAIRERVLGPDHPRVATSANNLAGLYMAQGRYAEAEPLYRRAIAIREKALGPGHPDTGGTLSNLGLLLQNQGRYAEAEPLLKRALTIDDETLGSEHVNVATSLNNLAGLYVVQNRFAEAGPLLERSLAIREKAQGRDDVDVAIVLDNLGQLRLSLGRHKDAEALHRRALAIYEKSLGPEHPYLATSLGYLAALRQNQGDLTGAEALMKRALAIMEKALGPAHPEVADSQRLLAGLYFSQGKYAQAEPLYKRALASQEKVLGPEHPNTAVSLGRLAELFFVQGDWERAAAYWRRGSAVIERRAQRNAKDLGQSVTGKRKSEAERLSWQFSFLVRAASRAREGALPNSATARETFQTAQRAMGSEAARTVAQMAARGASGEPALAALARQRQDLIAEWQKRDLMHNTAVALPPEQRDAKAEAANLARLGVIDGDIAAIDKRLAAEFPEYAALSSPAPAPVEAVQAELRSDEALVLFLDAPRWGPAPEETFVWVVTRTGLRWTRVEGFGEETLNREVAALRCGLENANWDDPASWPETTPAKKLRKQEQSARRERCQSLTGVRETLEDSLPFDLGRAHKLYQALFGQFEDVIGDKRLLIVPSGALTQLPFHVLVTRQPVAGGAADYRAANWLVRRNAVTVLPAVSSLLALRKHATTAHKTGSASKPFIGFGNPVIGSPGEQSSGQELCPKSFWRDAAFRRSVNRGLARGDGEGAESIADIVRRQPSLPETADELCAVARDLGVPNEELRLGPRMTKVAIRRLSGEGRLAAYRIVHFATHGVTAGQLREGLEAGLIMTPGNGADDGYLAASEIAELRLDADLVILSACNTAAGGSESAEALSGLAKAFFYAQARALLVSHWAVYSDSTTKLITGAVRELSAAPGQGRAEALRRSMLKMIDGGARHEAHPAFWAPFVVVGEGA